MRIAQLADRRVAIWGYGREGRAALRALRKRLPGLALTLFCNTDEAAIARADLEQWSAQGDGSGAADNLRTITTPLAVADFGAFDVVVKSPGISAYRPELLEAQYNGVRFTSGTALWFAENPQARVIAVTGTKGKSTTSALIAHLLRALGRRVALAGNIGLPLLELLDTEQPPDWWVIELSSFQTRAAPRADVGVILNLYEEHLDWHGSRARYVDDKLALADVAQALVVSDLQAELLTRTHTHPHRITFGSSGGWHVADAFVDALGVPACARTTLALPGMHNALNACAALAAIDAAGEDGHRAAEYLSGFRALPHRLQELGEQAGLAWIDDSIASTPAATREALASLGERAACVLVGGFDRGVDWQPFADHVRRTPPQAIVTMGANGARIAALLRATGGEYRLHESTDLATAVASARALATAGATVLLSPGAPSFDQFHDYAERGRAFARLAGFDPDAIGAIEGLGIA